MQRLLAKQQPNSQIFRPTETITPTAHLTMCMDDINITTRRLLETVLVDQEKSQENQKYLNIATKKILEAILVSQENLEHLNAITKKILEATLINQKYLNAILKELRDEADEGEFITLIETVTTTDFTFVDSSIEPGHSVKGYAVTNDGPNTVYIAHNSIREGLQPDLVDVTSSISRFQQILPGEEIRYIFNRKKVYNLAILARDGDSICRIWLTW